MVSPETVGPRFLSLAPAAPAALAVTDASGTGGGGRIGALAPETAVLAGGGGGDQGGGGGSEVVAAAVSRLRGYCLAESLAPIARERCGLHSYRCVVWSGVRLCVRALACC